MKTWKAKVKVNGSVIEVRIQAQTASDARKLLEAQYGKNSIFLHPVEVKS